MKRKILSDGLARAVQRLFIAVLATGLTLGTGPTPVAHAAIITVNTTDDELNADGDCSLREAIRAANLDATVSGCAAGNGDDTILLPAGTYVLTIMGIENDAASGDLDIRSNLTITGAGAATTIIDGNSGVTGDRVFHLLSGDVTISGVTIQNGNPGNAVGGGIAISGGTLALVSSTVASSTAGLGGGIYIEAASTLTLTGSTVSGNVATLSGGGGIFNWGALSVTGSTISDNRAAYGGGINSQAGNALTLTNSTLSGNTAAFYGGGIIVYSGTVGLNNVTIAKNTADGNGDGTGNGGGIAQMAGTVNLRNTIIAGNIDTGGQEPDCSGTLTSQGYNLVQSTLGCTIVGDATGNLSGQNPNLGPLQDNGGSTLTQALMPGSPAINAANPAVPGSGGNACEAFDQRGTPRPQGPRCDIGAVETYYRLYLSLIVK